MATEALLKIINADGDLKKVTESEENYVAYQAGQWFADKTLADNYQGSLGDSDGVSIGTLTDTFFDQAVGDHGILTSSSTVYTLKQRFAAGATDFTNNANFFKPLTLTGTNTDITAANDASMDTICDRLLETIFTNDYPGTFKLASSTPTDYSIHRLNVFTDTRTDGTSVQYNIYKRNSGTGSVPLVCRPVRQETKGSADVKTYNDTEIRDTFGPYTATRIIADGVGSYQIRSSAQGVPVAAGTWVAKGTATDTKQDSANQDYTRNSTRTRGSTFSRNSTNIFTTDFLNPATGNFTRTSIRNSIGLNSTSDFAANYTRNTAIISTRTTQVDYESTYAGNYLGNYINTYTGDFTGNYIGNYLGDFTGDYVATFTRTRYAISNAYGPTYSGIYRAGFRTLYYVGDFDGANYTRNSTSIFTRDSTRNSLNNFNQDYIGDYIGEYTTAYTSNYVGNYTGDFIGNYEQIYTGDYIPDFVGDYVGDYDANFEGNYTADYLGDFEGNYAIDYLGDYIGNFEGLTVQVASSTIETYTLYVRIS